jgi:hypothetical protein
MSQGGGGRSPLPNGVPRRRDFGNTDSLQHGFSAQAMEIDRRSNYKSQPPVDCRTRSPRRWQRRGCYLRRCLGDRRGAPGEWLLASICLD